MGPRARLDAVTKQVPASYRVSNPGRPIHSLITIVLNSYFFVINILTIRNKGYFSSN